MLSHRLHAARKNPLGDIVRVLQDDGSVDPSADPNLSRDDAVRLYRGMTLERILDNRMLALQRQGRIGFYGPSVGQEAAIVGAAMAMEPDDWIVPQYREPGAALLRGMPLKDLICQFMTNGGDPAKGRQMPCHYVFAKGHYLSISSPVGTQIPHAMGIAWGMKLRKEPAAVLVYFLRASSGCGAGWGGLLSLVRDKLPCAGRARALRARTTPAAGVK